MKFNEQGTWQPESAEESYEPLCMVCGRDLIHDMRPDARPVQITQLAKEGFQNSFCGDCYRAAVNSSVGLGKLALSVAIHIAIRTDAECDETHS